MESSEHFQYNQCNNFQRLYWKCRVIFQGPVHFNTLPYQVLGNVILWLYTDVLNTTDAFHIT